MCKVEVVYDNQLYKSSIHACLPASVKGLLYQSGYMSIWLVRFLEDIAIKFSVLTLQKLVLQ